MKRYSHLTLVGLIGFGADVSAKTVDIAYEMPSYVSGEVQKAGTHLNYPGDRYRYTFVIDDLYSNDPSYRIKTAMVGVHILDDDRGKNAQDNEHEWGRILINEKPQHWIKPSYLKEFDYHHEDKEELSNLMEIQDDFEISSFEGGIPPYIFDVTSTSEKNRMLTIEVINLREDGSINSDSNYGNFTILRVGYRVTWEKDVK